MSKETDKIYEGWEIIHAALVEALRKVDRPTLRFFADYAANNEAVTEAAQDVLEDMDKDDTL